MAVIGFARGHTFDSPGLISRVGRKLFPSIKVRPVALAGLSLYLDPANLSHLVAVDELLLHNVYCINRVPFMADLVVDCGANIGVFTLLASASFPDAKVVAFEPDPQNLVWLRRQTEMNRLSVTIVNAAVSDANGHAPFASGLGIGSALVPAGDASRDVMTVRTIRLADSLSAQGAEGLILKLDVEGAEEVIIPDIMKVLPTKCAIFFETHRGAESWTTASALLSSACFDVELIRTRDPYREGFALRTRLL